MTSYVLEDHEKRAPVPAAWSDQPHCIFCRIIAGNAPAYRLYENEMVVAILDIAPLRPGHTLVIPKTHVSHVSELPDAFAAACGVAVSRLARAVSSAMQNTGLNVVCNQEYAQAVFHVHYHIIPAPRKDGVVAGAAAESASELSRSSSSGHAQTQTAADPAAGSVPKLTEQEMHWRELEARNELKEEDALVFVESIKAQLSKSSL